MTTKSLTSVIVLTASLIFASCGNNSNESTNESTEQVKNATYQCPMKCEGEKTYDAPGTCPVCSMDLKPVSP